jgi:hypothetical protein
MVEERSATKLVILIVSVDSRIIVMSSSLLSFVAVKGLDGRVTGEGRSVAMLVI